MQDGACQPLGVGQNGNAHDVSEDERNGSAKTIEAWKEP